MSSDVEKKLKALGIGRFQVMALLQAARYYRLLGDSEKAKSFGLNRAVFYAWAKHYGPRRPPHVSEQELERISSGQAKTKCPEGFAEVLGECVGVSPRGYFEIGGAEQLPRDFDQQVLHKIRLLVDPEKAWQAALDYVSKFPSWVLRDPAKFYKYVYEPVRDRFFADLVSEGLVEPPKGVIERLESLDKMLEKAKKAQKSLLDYAAGEQDLRGTSRRD